MFFFLFSFFGAVARDRTFVYLTMINTGELTVNKFSFCQRAEKVSRFICYFGVGQRIDVINLCRAMKRPKIAGQSVIGRNIVPLGQATRKIMRIDMTSMKRSRTSAFLFLFFVFFCFGRLSCQSWAIWECQEARDATCPRCLASLDVTTCDVYNDFQRTQWKLPVYFIHYYGYMCVLCSAYYYYCPELKRLKSERVVTAGEKYRNQPPPPRSCSHPKKTSCCG